MLNYIWGGLIIFSLVFAAVYDINDFRSDTYRNGQPFPVEIEFPDGYQADTRRVPVAVHIDTGAYREFYGSDQSPAPSYAGVLVQTVDGRQLRFASGQSLPEPLETIRSMTGTRDGEIVGEIATIPSGTDSLATVSVLFPHVRFVKMNAIAKAALDFAETAVTIALGLIGALALWMGLLKIAEASGLLFALVRATQPVLRKLFPEIPEGHPALGMIALNLTANMLGLGNAATPLGLKAMEELQTLNQTEDTATNSMVMLLALNTASVQIVPPVLLVAIMGLQINQLFFSILIVTLLSAIIAVTVTKLIGRMKGYQASDPARLALDEEDADTQTEN